MFFLELKMQNSTIIQEFYENLYILKHIYIKFVFLCVIPKLVTTARP